MVGEMNRKQRKKSYQLITVASFGALSFGFINNLLILNLINELKVATATAYHIFGLFNALAFSLPVLGGFIARKYLNERCALIGVNFMLLGMLLLSKQRTSLIVLGLSLLAWGNGLFATNLMSQISDCFDKQDTAVSKSFLLFYVGTNLGFFVSSLLASYLIQIASYAVAFNVATLALIVSVVLFYRVLLKSGTKLLGAHWWDRDTISLLLISVAGIILVHTLIQAVWIDLRLEISTLILGYIMVAYKLIKQVPDVYQAKVRRFFVLSVLTLPFWICYFFQFSYITLFIDQHVSHHLYNLNFGTPSFSALNPLLLIFLGMVMYRFGRTSSIHSGEYKILMGLMCTGIGFFSLALGLYLMPLTVTFLPITWALLALSLLTVAELLISPTGMALASQLSPPKYEAILLGSWQLMIGIASMLSGLLGTYLTPTSTLSKVSQQIHYQHVFIALFMVFCTMVLFGWLKQVFHSPTTMMTQNS